MKKGTPGIDDVKYKVRLKWIAKYKPKPKGQRPSVWTYGSIDLEWTYPNPREGPKMFR